MTAILTHYVGPTNTRGARIVAESCGLRKVVPYDHSSDTEGAHAKAALALILGAGWGGTWIMGGTRKGWAFVGLGGYLTNGRPARIVDSGKRVVAKGPVTIVNR